MTQEQIIDLISPGIAPEESIWADLGAGSGNFTMALDSILGFEGTIFALDQKLDILRKRIETSYVRSKIHLLESDLSNAKEFLPALDGILMANTLHFIKDQSHFLSQFKALLKPGGSFLIIEYDRTDANQWVPYPISLTDWQRLAMKAGLTLPEEIGRLPSLFDNREIYAALCHLPLASQ